MTTQKQISTFLHDHFGLKELKERKPWTYALYSLLIFSVLIFLFQLIQFIKLQKFQLNFQPIDWNTWQGRTVAEYFVEHLDMSPEEASEAAENGATFFVSKDMTVDGLVSNLEYYGFVRDKEALRYALERADDRNPGSEDALEIGNNDIERGVYSLGQEMSPWDIAIILLNYPEHPDEDWAYTYMFMPGGESGTSRLRPDR